MPLDKYLSKEDLAIWKEIEDARAQRRKLQEIAEHLKIPYTTSPSGNESLVKMQDLWDILSDETKLKELLCRLRNKAFW